MGWLRIDVDMFLFLLQRLPQYSLLDSSQQPVLLHTDVFEDSHGGKVTTAPLHPPHNRHVLCCCLLIFPRPCVLLCKSKALSTYVSKRTLQSTHKGSSGVFASAAENCLSFLLYNTSRCRNGRCGWCARKNDGSIRVEISWLLTKVLTRVLDTRKVSRPRPKPRLHSNISAS